MASLLVAHRSDAALEREMVMGLIAVLRRRGHKVEHTHGATQIDVERAAESADHILLIDPRRWWPRESELGGWEHLLRERLELCAANEIEQFVVIAVDRRAPLGDPFGALPRFALPADWDGLLEQVARSRRPLPRLRSTGPLHEPRPMVPRPTLDRAIDQAIADAPNRMVWIRGGIGAGKTVLLRSLVGRLDARSTVVHVARPGIAATLHPSAIFERLELARESSRSVLLAIDGLEQLLDRTDARVPDGERRRLVGLLAGELPTGLTVVATSRPLAPGLLGGLEPTIDLDARRWAAEQDALVDALLASKPRDDIDALRELACSNPAAAKALLDLREAKLDDTELPVRFAALLERAFVRLLQLPATIRRAVLAGLALLRAAPALVPDRLLAAALGPATLEILERHAAEWLRRDAGQLALTHPFAARYLATELDLHDVGPHFDMLGGLARLRQRGALVGPAGVYASQHEMSHKQATRGLSVRDLWMRAVAVMQRAAGDGSLEGRLEAAVASSRPEHLALLEAMLRIIRQHSLALTSDPTSLPSLLWTGLVARKFAPRTLDEELSWGDLRPTIRLQNSLSNVDRCHRILSGHSHPVRGCGLSRDGGVAVTFGSDGTLRIWDVQAGRARVLELGGWCESCALTPDGHRVAVGVSERVVLIDTRTGEKIAEHKLHSSTATAMAISSDGTRVLSGDRNGLVALWNVNGQPFELGKHGDRVTRCTIASDGQFGVSGGDDKVVRVWSFGEAELRHELRGHSYAISGLALTRDAERLVSICIGEARVWDPATGVQQDRFDELGESCAGAVVVADDREVLMAEAGERVTRWTLDDSKVVVRHLAHPVDMYCIAASEDGEWYLTGGADHVARLWRRADIPTDEEVGVIIQVSALLPGERPDTVWISSGGQGTRLLALDDQHVLVHLEGYTNATALAWCDDRLYVAGSNKRITMYSGSSGKAQASWEPGKDWLRTVAVDRPRQRIAFAGDDKRVFMSGLDGSQLRTIAAHDDWIHALAFTPDGKLVAVDGDGFVKLWDPDGDRGLLHYKSEANSSLHALAIDSAGKHVTVAGAGGPIEVFSLTQKGPRVRSFEGHVGAVRGLALRSDDRVLVSAGSDCTLRLWSFGDGRALASITLGYPLTQVVFVGERLVVGDVSGNLMIFEVDWSTIE